MSEKLTDEQIAVIRDGCEGVTPGEWEYYSHEPGGWRAPESPAAMVNSNGDKVIDCTWACATEYGERTYRHIARCDPETIRALATEALESRATLEAQAARIEELTRERDIETRRAMIAEARERARENAVYLIDPLATMRAVPDAETGDPVPPIAEIRPKRLADLLDQVAKLEGALRRIEHEAIIRKPENAAQTVDDLRALARTALGGNDAR